MRFGEIEPIAQDDPERHPVTWVRMHPSAELGLFVAQRKGRHIAGTALTIKFVETTDALAIADGDDETLRKYVQPIPEALGRITILNRFNLEDYIYSHSFDEYAVVQEHQPVKSVLSPIE